MVEAEDITSGGIIETALLSGVRALKTGGGAALRSGVLGLGREDGPDTARLKGVRVIGEGAYMGIVGIGGMGGTFVSVPDLGRD